MDYCQAFTVAKLPDFAATLLHEALHAKYEISDVSRDFESYLTELVGDLAARLIILTNTEQGAGGYSLKPAAELDEAKYEAAKGLFTSKLERLNNDESEFLKWVAVKFPDSAMPYAKRFLEERANPKSQSLHSTQEK